MQIYTRRIGKVRGGGRRERWEGNTKRSHLEARRVWLMERGLSPPERAPKYVMMSHIMATAMVWIEPELSA